MTILDSRRGNLHEALAVALRVRTSWCQASRGGCWRSSWLGKQVHSLAVAEDE
eukprot:CAMPEP_0171499572 /NCGR_PEP_ID=MMETSP0958-20121227/8507_1 /TAXON_ID=87120 /ORGANISM="Aurantiochytrium limacinum, Strain ATCCMYA-1381" /LENGTH=52 /DNA_ID=CAMNT_0012034151 /DNA_START=32 /DNA_END=190 /DNA_ORIENTATION=-